MDTRLVALAIPFFFLLIGVELVVARACKLRVYRLHDAIASLACGVGEQVIVVFTAGLALAAYAYVADHAALVRLTPGPVTWVALFVLVDHQFYWFHRASHRVNVMWAGHAVHHQSEEYNLSTALRQSWIENLLAWPFYVPLAFLGFPFGMFVLASTLNTLYQFWIHTRLVGRLGPVEWVMNTPSSHRVHHAVDPEYIDRNYAGMFIVWDRLYGTYAREVAEPTYGTVKPLASFNPLWANVDGWVKLARMARGTSRLVDKVRVLFAPPDWRPTDLGGPVRIPAVDRAAYRKYETSAPGAVDRYVLSQFVVVALVTSSIMWFAGTMPRPLLLAASSWVLVALVVWGGLFEARGWAIPLELCRHAVGFALAVAIARAMNVPVLPWVAAGVAAISSALLAPAWNRLRSASTTPAR
jgi:sterol desaturase/sphingolipid hydroxylase (fatty acid hydroxylase superfamily)